MIYLTHWLSKIDFNLFDSHFLIITGSAGVVTCMKVAVESEEMFLLKVISLVQNDVNLGVQPKHRQLQLSRACQSKFPVFNNFDATVSNSKKFNELTGIARYFNFAQILNKRKISFG